MTQEIDLALEHHRAGRLDQAEMLYRRILERQPANPEALYFLGVLAHQAGRNDEAIELIEKAHREGGARAQSLNSLGMAYLGCAGAWRPREASCTRIATRCKTSKAFLPGWPGPSPV